VPRRSTRLLLANYHSPNRLLDRSQNGRASAPCLSKKSEYVNIGPRAVSNNRLSPVTKASPVKPGALGALYPIHIRSGVLRYHIRSICKYFLFGYVGSVFLNITYVVLAYSASTMENKITTAEINAHNTNACYYQGWQL
jgi:hypothetical protein